MPCSSHSRYPLRHSEPRAARPGVVTYLLGGRAYEPPQRPQSGLVIDENVNVFEYILKYAWAMLGASFAPQLIILLFWKRASYAGCIAGMVSGFLAAVAWDPLYEYVGGGIKVYNLTVAFCIACVVNVTVSRLTPDSPPPADPGA